MLHRKVDGSLNSMSNLGLSEKGGGIAPSFFYFSGIVLLLLPLLAFNALPSDQFLLGPVFLLMLGWLFFQRVQLLSFGSLGFKFGVILLAGPLYLLVTPFFVSYWPWLSLWMAASLLMLPVGFVAAFSLRALKAETFLLAFIVVSSMNAAIIFWLAYQGVDRPAGFLIDPNLAANIFAIAFLACVYLIRAPYIRWILLIQLILGSAIFLTQSRGAIFSLSGALIVFFILCRFRSIPIGYNLARTLVVLVLSFIISVFIQADSSSVAGLSLSDRPESMQDRLDMWASALQLFSEEMWWGTGLGSFALRYPAVRAATETTSVGFFAHNDYLQLLMELGVVGFVSYFALPVSAFFICLWACFKKSRLKDGCFLVLSVSVISLVAVHSFFNFVIYHPLVSLFVGVIMGFSLREALPVEDRDSKRKPIITFLQRSMIAVVFMAASITFAADLYGRSLTSRAQAEGDRFNLQSPTFYRLLPLEYITPLNVEIKNYLVAAQVNTALNLFPSDVGKGLIDEVRRQVSINSWLQWGNCSQSVNEARLVWLEEQETAIKSLEALIAKVPNCIQGRITLAEAHMAVGEYEEAIRLLNRGVDRFKFKENRGDGPIILLETLVHAYEDAGRGSNARAIEAYLNSFKAKRDLGESDRWQRSIELW